VPVVVALLATAVRADFQSEYDHAAQTLLCDCGCSPQSVHACACGRAAEMRGEIAAKVRGGQTGQQILDEAVAQRGQQALIAPPAAGFNVVAWLAPTFALLLGIGGVALLARRWRRPPSAAPAGPPAGDPNDPYLARLEREVRELR
jgi:cytochrome c-type biogenesis protein CcmH/NrfF